MWVKNLSLTELLTQIYTSGTIRKSWQQKRLQNDDIMSATLKIKNKIER